MMNIEDYLKKKIKFHTEKNHPSQIFPKKSIPFIVIAIKQLLECQLLLERGFHFLQALQLHILYTDALLVLRLYPLE